MIKIQNIYYMLSYAFQELQASGYREVATESFSNVTELCTSILIRGISMQLKRGLEKEYIETKDTLSGIRGSIQLSESIQKQTMRHNQMVCTYDVFSINTNANRILKTTILTLLSYDINLSQKRQLKRLLLAFQGVDCFAVASIPWNRISYHRNNSQYRMLISICYLLLHELLQTTDDGNFLLMEFFDEQRMSHLYETFLFEFFKQEYPHLIVSASRIPWGLDDGVADKLPVMQTDIMIKKDNRILIIDAKYYNHTMQVHFETNTIHSAHLYQIFTYVKNKEFELKKEGVVVSGLLLYARTDEEIQPNQIYQMSGNQIGVKTLDLNQEFSLIRKELDAIIMDFFD